MPNKESPASKGGKWIIIAVIAVMTVALIVCIVLLVSRSGDTGEVQPSINNDNNAPSTALDRGFVDESNADNIMSELSDKVEEGMFECMMSTSWTFEDGASSSPNSYVANVESNRHAIFFDVYIDPTEELIYSSPILPVGSEIRGIKLDKELSAGDYDAIVMYTLVNEDYEEVSTVGFRITITVKK